ncbi:MAG: hypothetical protein ACN6OP_24990 [Pseudomonadales bacterium]
MSDEVVMRDFAKDYFPFQFPGFGRPGHCFLRVNLFDSNVSVLCAQLKDYHSTSVTNGLEGIIDSLVDTLLKERLTSGKSVVEVIEKFPLLRRLTRSDQEVSRSRYLSARRKLLERCRWFEYYPPSAGVADEGSLALVSVRNAGAPSWSYAMPEAFAAEVPEGFFHIAEDLSKWRM